MGAFKPPIESLVDSFQYHEFIGLNDWSESEFKEPIMIENCRIDRTEVYSTITTGRQLLYRAVLFCYGEGLTTPLPDFKIQSKIMFDGKEHIVTNVLKHLEPFSDDVYSYEVEVV